MGYDPGVRRPGLARNPHRRRVHLGVPRKTPGKEGMPPVGRSWESAGMRLRPKFYPLIGKGDVMKHTEAEIEDAARRFERLADDLDPASVAPEDLSDLRAVTRDERRVTPGRSGSCLIKRGDSTVPRATPDPFRP
jgi:HAMP domain-containing protein